MARLCEQGALAQSDFVLGQVVFTSTSLQEMRLAPGVVVQQEVPLSSAHFFADNKVVEDEAGTEEFSIDNGSEATGSNVPVSETFTITNT